MSLFEAAAAFLGGSVLWRYVASRRLKCAQAQDLTFIRSMPKVELHAHISGSVRESSVLHFLQEEYSLALKAGKSYAEPIREELHMLKLGDRNLKECFDVFKILHRVLNSRERVSRVVREIVEDFVQDGVVYAELRTTPRGIVRPAYAGASSGTKEEYVQTVISTLESVTESQPIVVRLLLSIDRSRSLAEALDTVELAHKLSEECKWVVGVDFSGNPVKNEFKMFLPALLLAKQYGLRVTIHLGEVEDSHHETEQMLAFAPQRLGHAVLMSADAVSLLLESPIPIEICPTSNLRTRSCKDIARHPFGFWLRHGYPVSVCTDDMGVFNISLSSEYHLLATTFGLDRQNVLDVSVGGLAHIFEQSTQVRAFLFARFQRFGEQHGLAVPARDALWSGLSKTDC